MSGVHAVSKFDAKVVNNNIELDWSLLVYPEVRHQFALVVPMLVQKFFEQFICH